MAINWSKLYENYKGLWVALENDEITVVASGKKLQKVLQEAHDKGINKPIVTKVPKKNLAYIGACERAYF